MPQSKCKQTSEYRFGRCRIILGSREILRDDKVIPVEPKVYDLLVYLISNRHRAVDKNELQDEIWAGTIVSEAALTRCVMKARRAICDEPAEAITTVRGHGYRFTAAVDERRGSGDISDVPSPHNKPSLVVLPFVNISKDPEQEYFSDGITEDIITELSRFRSLFVIARSTAFSYKGRAIGAAEIARDLGVTYVVDGSVQRSGDHIRLNVRLVDASSAAQTWAERYDREVEDVFLLQDELAATIAATVGGRVEVTRARQRIDRARFDCYDCVLRAQALYYDFRKEANAEARAILEGALEIDPENARALAILAAVHSMDSWTYWAEDSEESQRLSYEFGKRSIELDDTDSLAQALFAEILHDVGEFELADVHFRRAIALNPNDIAAHALYASKLSATSRIDVALDHLAIAEQLDPFGLFWIPLIKGSVMYVARRYDEALAALKSMTSPPVEASLVMLATLGRLGRRIEATLVRQKLLEAAEREMPNYPGPGLDDWHHIIIRMRGNPGDAEIEHVMESLRLAGWE